MERILIFNKNTTAEDINKIYDYIVELDKPVDDNLTEAFDDNVMPEYNMRFVYLPVLLRSPLKPARAFIKCDG